MSDMVVKRVGAIMKKELLAEQTYICEKHGSFKCRPIKVFGRIIESTCPMCDLEMEEERAIEEKKKEATAIEYAQAMRREEREKDLTEMNIGRKFWGESFETFNAYTQNLKRYLDICVSFANDPSGRMLLMMGKNGNGKNHLAASILKKTGGCIFSVIEIELLLKDCYSKGTGEFDLYQRLCNTTMLIINEIGKHKSGEWETNFLSYIINKRYENLMPTVLITNTHLRDNCPKKGCPECLQHYLGNDVLSRIVEDGEIMIFNEDDYRYKKREARSGGQK